MDLKLLDIIGKSEIEAHKFLPQPYTLIRVIARDDRWFLLTAEYMPTRVNVIVHNKIIFGIVNIG